MHLWRPFIAFVVFAALPVLGAVVYKWTDADGVVHFSDQPGPGAEKVTIGQAPLYGTPKQQAATPPKKAQEPAKAPVVRLGYADIKITSPAAEKTFFDEPIPVNLMLNPGLRQDHMVTWYLNGSPLSQDAVSFTIPYLDRGAYTLYATITEPATQASTNSDTVTFYVRQPSVLAPQYPKK
ncbi:MAG: DUF4124 domain-containing protein [Steroidobacterales bacterium]